jgi:amino acid adenylation domain-containing protein
MSSSERRLGELSREDRALLFARLRAKKQDTVREGGTQIPYRSGEHPPPLSFAQQRLWFLDRLEPGEPTYNSPASLLIEGDLRPDLLLRVLTDLVARHETLRTTFAEVDGEPVQVISPVAQVTLPIVDLSALEMSALEISVRTREANRLELAEAHLPFDLAAGPLLRTTLLRLGAAEHILLLTAHHIAFDGWSQGVFMRDLNALYVAHATGTPAALAELPIQYADFAVWQRSWLTGAVLEQQLAYWRDRLAGAPPAIDLPTDRARPPRPSGRGGKIAFTVEQELSEHLRALARQEGVTLFMVLLAGMYALLARTSGQDDILAGTTVANRTRPELEGLIGFFVNTLVLRAGLSGDPSAVQLLAGVRQDALGAYAHQDLPFERLVEELRPQRDTGRTPLFQVIFSFQSSPQGPLDLLPGLRLKLRPVEQQVSLFDLTWNLSEYAGGLEGALEYSTDVFEPATAERLTKHFCNLLRALSSTPAEPLSRLPLFDTAERAELLAEHAASAEFPWRGSVVEQLARWVELTPEAVALTCEGRELTYAELDHRVTRLAHRLRGLGVGPETPVALCCERGPEMIVAIVSVLAAGGFYVPLDPAWPGDRLVFTLADSGARWLLIALAGEPPAGAADLLAAAEVRGVATLDLAAENEDAPPIGQISPISPIVPTSAAYMIYTSGSTGRPKGVAITHDNLQRLLASARRRFDFGPRDVWTLFHSYAFDFSVWEIWGALCHGGRLVIVPHLVSRSPEAFAELLADERVTVLNQTPAAFYQLVAIDERSGPIGPALRWVIFGGEALETRRLAPWVRRHGGDRIDRPRLINMYGITETTVHVTFRALTRSDVAGDLETGSPIGRPLADLAAYVLDARLEPVPRGVHGELSVGGAGLARGYPGRPELTAERFVPDPWSGGLGARLYRTGDRVRLRVDGELEYLGRTDRQVKLRGFRIELAEIEAVIAEHPAVREAAVALVPRVAQDSGEEQLAAYVVASPTEQAPFDAADLRRHLSHKLPAYMVPAAFVELPALPLSPNGKLDRRALAALAHIAAPLAAGTEYMEPATATERKVAAVWSEVLGTERIGARDDFFALGGHSLLVTRAIARLREAFHCDLAVRLFFDRPILAEQAAWIDGLRHAGIAEEPLTSIPRRDGRELPLSFGQQQLWLIDQIAPGGSLYNIPAVIALDGDLDTAALAAALAGAVERHESLRTRFERTADGARQVIDAADTAPVSLETLPGIDLTALPADLAESEAEQLAAAEAARPFDLERGPVLRAALLRLGPARHVLLLTVHHIVADGWSMEILTRDLAAFYNGDAGHLPPLPIQFADFAFHQRQRLRGERLDALLAFWRNRLADPPPPLPLPLDRPRAAVRSELAAERSRAIPAPLPGAVLRLGEEARATPFITLLAVFQALLARYSTETDLVLGTPVANRHQREVEDLVGYFVNTLVLRTEVTKNLPFRTLLERARDTAVDAYAHQELPFEKLVEELRPPRDLSLTPFFQVLFELQNAPRGEIVLPGLALRALNAGTPPAKFDLSLTISLGSDGGLFAGVSYARELFDATTIDRLLAHYTALVAQAGASPDKPIGELELLSTPEKQQIVQEWNDTRTALREPETITAWIEAQAAATPDAIAVRQGSETWSYARLDATANRVARHLRSLGVGPESRVGLALERSPEMVAALLGVLKAGGAYVPLDPGHPAERLAWVRADAGVSVVLEGEDFEDIKDLRDLKDEKDEKDEKGQTAALPDGLAYVMYTSGSTGRPKGVGISQRNVCFSTAARRRVFPEPVKVFQPTASFTVDSSVPGIFWTLCSGGTIALPAERFHLDLPHFIAELARLEVSHLDLLPSLYSLVLEQAAPGQLAGLRVVIVAGEACPPALVARHREKLPGVRLVNEYGPTEGTVWCSAYDCSGFDPAAARVPVGRPIDNARLLVLDAVELHELPIGAEGEIALAGGGVARGYLGRPDLTAASFVPDPWSDAPGGRLYRTGDRGRQLVDGRIEVLGRIDHQVKIRGFRVELGEIESALADLPGVREAAVIAHNDSLVAYIATNANPAVSDLRESLRKLLPEPMVPSSFVLLPDLPRTPAGKVDRRALPALTAKPAPAATTPTDLSTRTLRDTAAGAIAAVWREVLGVPSVGLDDNFFDLGGHSLLLVQAHGRLRERFPQLTALDLFRYPTVATLAAYLTAGTPVAEDRVLPHEAAPSNDIAIIGMACRFPGAPNIEAFWRNLTAGVESIEQLANDRPDLPGYVPAASLIDSPDQFDAGFFSFTPREAAVTDPQHRVFLECAWEALERAGYDPRSAGRVGVYAGAGQNSYIWNLLSNPGTMQAIDTFQATVSTDKDFLTTRTSYKLGLEGPSVAVQTACSTSLVAVHLACRALADGECDLALAGGVSIRNLRREGYVFEEGGILSPDGHCRAFDAQAHGTVGGDGAGIVVLKRLADALAGGDSIDAVIKGTAINNDGALKVGFTAPGIEGQAKVVSAALRKAGVDPATISYVEAHGTATPLGDPIEVAALVQAFGGAGTSCALGSVKTNIGHLDTAAGVAGLIKTALALKHRLIPPSLHFTAPNPAIGFAGSPFHVNAALTPWPSTGGPRRAGVSSFGIGGTNAHAVLEEAPVSEAQVSQPGWQLLSLSARSGPALEQMAANLAAHLGEHPDLDLSHLADIAHTLRVGRRAFDHRRIVLCRDLSEARAALATSDPQRVWSAVRPTGPTGDAPSVAFLLPGQGAQEIDMGLALYRDQPVFRAEIDRAAEALEPELGLDLRRLLYPPPEDRQEAAAKLGRTRFTQPALFAVEYALAQLWRSLGIEPAALLGHSVGEFVAACLAGVLTWEDALSLVALRGRLVDELPPGAMLSIPLPADEVAPLLGGTISIAAINAVDRTVVSGPLAAIEKLEERMTLRLADRGLQVRRLATSHAFHSAMMDPAVAALTQAAARIALRPPQIPYLSNVTGTWIRPDEATDPAYWGRHLRQPVRFADGLRTLLASGSGVLLETGPGETLGRLARRAGAQLGLPSLPSQSVELPLFREAGGGWERGSGGEGLDGPAVLLRTLGRLWLAGVPVDWTSLFPTAGRRRVPLPTYPFERRRYWTEPGSQLTLAAQEKAGVAQDLADSFYLPSWTRSLPPPSLRDGAELPAGPFLLFKDGDLGDALEARLRQAGRALATVVAGDAFSRFGPGSYAIRPGIAVDYEALLEGLATEGLEPAQIVDTWNTGPIGNHPEALDRSFYGPLFLLRALARRAVETPVQLWAVTTHLHDVAGGETVAPKRAALLGLFKTAAIELPAVMCRTLDLADGSEGAVEHVLAELAAHPPETVIAYRGRQRWTQTFAPIRLEAGGPSRLRPQGVYLVTGGLGGIGEAVARCLIESVAARVVLVGRSHPAGHRIHRMQRLEETAARAGGEVVYVAADVADRAGMEAVRDLIRERWGTVHGIIHAAGVKGGGLIARQERDIATAVLAPKIHGTLLLAELFPPRDLDFCVLCSSLAATLGGLGQADYSAANAFQDAFAFSEPSGRIISIAWDTWKDAGMAVDTSAAPLLEGLDEAAGIEALRRILGQVELPQVLVSLRDLNRLAAETGALTDLAVPDLHTAPEERHTRPALATAYVAPRTEAETRLAAIWQDLLGITPVGVYDDFFELGGDSVLGLRIVARAREHGVVLTPGQLFQSPTIAALAEIAASTAEAVKPEVTEPVREAGDTALTPEDLPDAEISARDLATLLAQLGGDL